eukprot:gene7622-7686_t
MNEIFAFANNGDWRVVLPFYQADGKTPLDITGIDFYAQLRPQTSTSALGSVEVTLFLSTLNGLLVNGGINGLSFAVPCHALNYGPCTSKITAGAYEIDIVARADGREVALFASPAPVIVTAGITIPPDPTAFQQVLGTVTDLGAVFEATSTTPATVAAGLLTLSIPASESQQFAPSRWMSVMSADAMAMMAGLVSSWDRFGGILQMQVTETYGSGQYQSWLISPSSPPILGAALVDGGCIDGQSAANTIPYSYSGPQATSEDIMDGGTV